MIVNIDRDDLVAVVLVETEGEQYAMTLQELPHELVPLTRRTMAKGLRELADAIDAAADELDR